MTHPFVLSALLTLNLASPALAQEPADAPGDTVSYSFEDDKVLGDGVAPLGEIMTIRKRGQRDSLVRARQSFVPELLHSVEAL
jgi:hypothetical protein